MKSEENQVNKKNDNWQNFLLYSNSSMSWKTLNVHKNGLVKYFPSLKFVKQKKVSLENSWNCSAYKLLFMSLSSPPIAFFPFQWACLQWADRRGKSSYHSCWLDCWEYLSHKRGYVSAVPRLSIFCLNEGEMKKDHGKTFSIFQNPQMNSTGRKDWRLTMQHPHNRIQFTQTLLSKSVINQSWHVCYTRR